MRWLVPGAHGMLGTDMVAALTAAGESVVPVARNDLDLLDAASVSGAVAGHDVVVNCAAWTAVDRAEEHEAEAYDVNATAAGHLARAARQHDTRLVHLSTDYVFDGRAEVAYDEDAPLHPVSAYGRTKAAGEWAVRAEAPGHALVVRTAWLYGAHGVCFPRTIARLAHEQGEVAVVDDQRGQPTWTRDVADLVIRLVVADAPPGTWHATSSGEATWWGFARRVVASSGLREAVVTATGSSTFRRPAPRPAYSVLGHRRLHELGVAPIGDWADRWEAAAPVVLGAGRAR